MSNFEEFQWEAHFNDGSILPQFNESNEENSFKEVQEKLDKILYFKISNREHDFLVWPKEKQFTIGAIPVFFESKIENPRLVFFKRRRSSIPDIGIETEYFLGWQDTIDGKNQKVLLRFFNGKIYFVEE